MMRPRASMLTLLVAMALGAAAALWSLPRWYELRALADIQSEVGGRLDHGWRWLLEPDGSGQPRVASRLDAVSEALETAKPTALQIAADHLRRIDLWGWDHQPSSLILREAMVRADGGTDDQRIAAEQMLTCPLDLDADAAMPVFHVLLSSEDAGVRKLATRALFGWLGPDRAVDLERMRPFEHGDVERAVSTALRLVQATPDSGHRSLLNLQERHEVQEVFRQAPGHVPSYEAALLAEAVFDNDEAVDLAGRWMLDFDDRRKQAGALLAALLGVHGDLLAEVLEAAAEPQVRTTFRNALFALDRPVQGHNPIEFAYRTVHEAGGEFSADTVLCLLAAGRVDALEYLVTLPRPEAASIRKRTLLMKRFVPHWYGLLGLPVGTGLDVAEFFERVHVWWMLEHRRLVFDAETRTYR